MSNILNSVVLYLWQLYLTYGWDEILSYVYPNHIWTISFWNDPWSVCEFHNACHILLRTPREATNSLTGVHYLGRLLASMALIRDDKYIFNQSAIPYSVKRCHSIETNRLSGKYLGLFHQANSVIFITHSAIHRSSTIITQVTLFSYAIHSPCGLNSCLVHSSWRINSMH